jgi:hypothetical protein
MKLEITFKSGAQVTVDVTEFSTKRSQISNTYGELNWTTPKDWTRKLHSVDLEQIACLIAVED